jgi:hypothetical protein
MTHGNTTKRHNMTNNLWIHEELQTTNLEDQRLNQRFKEILEAFANRLKQQVQGAGPLDGGKRRGAFLHLHEAFTEDGTPLGAIGAKLWARPEHDAEHPRPSKAEKRRQHRSLTIEQKESIRWIEGFRDAQKLAERCPDTLCVSLCDSEGDMYDLFNSMLACVSIYLIVAWRTLYVCRLGRGCPDVPCDVIFESSEWQSV